jgi:hypothetical protein
LDDVDYNIFGSERWDHLPTSHSDEVLVIRPDGHQTRHLSKHIEELRQVFT